MASMTISNDSEPGEPLISWHVTFLDISRPSRIGNFMTNCILKYHRFHEQSPQHTIRFYELLVN